MPRFRILRQNKSCLQTTISSLTLFSSCSQASVATTSLHPSPIPFPITSLSKNCHFPNGLGFAFSFSFFFLPPFHYPIIPILGSVVDATRIIFSPFELWHQNSTGVLWFYSRARPAFPYERFTPWPFAPILKPIQMSNSITGMLSSTSWYIPPLSLNPIRILCTSSPNCYYHITFPYSICYFLLRCQCWVSAFDNEWIFVFVSVQDDKSYLSTKEGCNTRVGFHERNGAK